MLEAMLSLKYFALEEGALVVFVDGVEALVDKVFK
jgi:hypothetical protein